MDWYRLWVCDKRDNGPLPSPKSPCGGTELPVAFWMQPKMYPGTGSAASRAMSCERFAAMLELPYVRLKLQLLPKQLGFGT